MDNNDVEVAIIMSKLPHHCNSFSLYSTTMGRKRSSSRRMKSESSMIHDRLR